VSLSQRLRHRVLIQAKEIVTGPGGEPLGHEWVDFIADVPAEVLTGPGREFHAADAKQAETSARMTLRWFPGLLPTMRIAWEGLLYNITSIETDRTGRMEYRLRCQEGPTDGA